MRFYANENFPRMAVETLRALGHDVLTSFEAGNANRGVPDPDVLQFATALGRAVLTLNRRDFVRLAAEQPNHAGIVVCSVDPDHVALAHRVHAAIEAVGEVGFVVRVNRQA